MSEILPEKESFLNFSYLTSVFYNFVLISNGNFTKIKLSQNDDKFDKEFENLNFENYSNYLDNLSYLKNSGEEINKIKIELIKSVFGMEFNENEKEKILFKLCDKMTICIFTNKNKLIKLLCQQIIDFVFNVYELINLIIRNMDKNEKEKIQQITLENLIETGKIQSEKDSLLNQNRLLKDKIKSFKKKNNNKEKDEDILHKKNAELEKEISQLKETMKLFEEKIQNSLIKEKEERDKKEDEDKKKLEEQVKKLEEKVKKLNESNVFLFNEMQIMKKKDLTDENYQCMKNLNIELLKERIAYNDKQLALYNEKNDLEELKFELVKRDLKIKCLERLVIVYEKDLQVKETQIDKQKLEIEDLKKVNK